MMRWVRSRGGELGNSCPRQGELIPTKCHLASKISGLAVLSYRKMPPSGFRDSRLWLNSGHVLRKLKARVRRR